MGLVQVLAGGGTMFSALRNYLKPRVIFIALLIGLSLGLLFEGFMIGPEYRRYKPLYLILIVLLIEGAFIAWLWIREGKGGKR